MNHCSECICGLRGWICIGVHVISGRKFWSVMSRQEVKFSGGDNFRLNPLLGNCSEIIAQEDD